jgi:predicted RNase H-like nuclease (RuvC/YqgF family)
MALLITSLLVGCSTLRSDLCATVHTVMLEELRITEETARHIAEARECERHAQRLQRISEDLGALEIRDKALRQAVDGYRTELERLSSEYGRLAKAYRALPEANPDAEQQVREQLGPVVLDRAASVNGPRTQLRSACNGY